MNALTDQELRALRDKVYGKPSSDNNWEGCKNAWAKPEETEWLLKNASKPIATANVNR